MRLILDFFVITFTQRSHRADAWRICSTAIRADWYSRDSRDRWPSSNVCVRFDYAFGSSIYRPQFQVAQVWQVCRRCLSSSRGNHSLQFGYEFHENFAQLLFDLEAPQGAILTEGIYTNTPGFAPADFLLGDVTEAIYEKCSGGE